MNWKNTTKILGSNDEKIESYSLIVDNVDVEYAGLQQILLWTKLLPIRCNSLSI